MGKTAGMEFYAKDGAVFRKCDDGDMKLCEVSPRLLTPKLVAEEIAVAMNKFFGKS